MVRRAAINRLRAFWHKRIRDPFVAQLTQGITPEKLALTVAFGSAFALFPVLGTTTILCLIVGIVLRLNQPIIQIINQAFWPLHLPVIFGCVWLGEKIYHIPHRDFSLRRMHRLFFDSPGQFFHEFGTTLVCALTAWALLAPIYIALVYYLFHPAFNAIKKLRARATKPQPDA